MKHLLIANIIASIVLVIAVFVLASVQTRHTSDIAMLKTDFSTLDSTTTSDSSSATIDTASHTFPSLEQSSPRVALSTLEVTPDSYLATVDIFSDEISTISVDRAQMPTIPDLVGVELIHLEPIVFQFASSLLPVGTKTGDTIRIVLRDTDVLNSTSLTAAKISQVSVSLPISN